MCVYRVKCDVVPELATRTLQLMTGNLALSLKRKIYNHCISLVFTYGAKTSEVNRETREEVEDNTTGDGMKNVRCNIKRQEDSRVDQRTDRGCQYPSRH